jgi:hypothetical protein
MRVTISQSGSEPTGLTLNIANDERITMAGSLSNIAEVGDNGGGGGTTNSLPQRKQDHRFGRTIQLQRLYISIASADHV